MVRSLAVCAGQREGLDGTASLHRRSLLVVCQKRLVASLLHVDSVVRAHTHTLSLINKRSDSQTREQTHKRMSLFSNLHPPALFFLKFITIFLFGCYDTGGYVAYAI